MKIIITANEAMDLGIWDTLCKMKDINVWALNEGLMNSNDEIAISDKEAVVLGLFQNISAVHLDLWQEICDLKGIDPALHHEVVLSKEEAFLLSL